jgi:hypothetical protein
MQFDHQQQQELQVHPMSHHPSSSTTTNSYDTYIHKGNGTVCPFECAALTSNILLERMAVEVGSGLNAPSPKEKSDNEKPSLCFAWQHPF